ncbi:MAG: hypothetical protein HYW14_01095 [Planctomycetes bacterium]|nr:hypothetical protein [Planctomycetota bacterium]
MINYEQKDPKCNLNFAGVGGMDKSTKPIGGLANSLGELVCPCREEISAALINSLDYSGNNACLVIQRFC